MGEGFLGLCVDWLGDTYYIVNVYSSCNIHKKMNLWKELGEIKAKYNNGKWCIVGDFNSIKNAKEIKRASSQVNMIEIYDFRYFIEHIKVVDVPAIGIKFTWFNLDI